MKEWQLEAVVDNVSVITDLINEQLEAADCPPKKQFQIDLAVDELFTNIALYAYAPQKGDALVRFELLEDPAAALITLTDSGKPFNPLEAEEPDVSLPAEERKIGGLGIFMARKYLDGMEYEYKDGKNILRLKKLL